MNILQSLNKFSDIYAITANQTKKEKGDLFELFTYYLFKHDPRLNHNLQKIWLYKDVPKKVLEYLKLPDTDKGIDLITKIDGKYYAIQCKFMQDPTKIIPWAKLSTFFGLSFGITNRIAGGFLVTNTYNLCQQVIDSDLVVPIYDDYYDEIPKNFFKYINKDVIYYQQKYPLSHQSKCMISSLSHYVCENNDRGYINMACGSGKTLSAYWINEYAHSDLTVIFVPSLYLLSQFYTDWINQSYAEKKDINYILIGSDADTDEIKYKTNGLILSTDPKQIKKYLLNRVGKTVVICTYQSSDRLATACGNKIRFDFGIFDEAHKTVGQKNKQFSRMLTDKYMFIDKRLFMTATPKDYIGAKNNVVGMNNENIYGECIYSYITGQAVEDKRLTDYCVLSIDATNASIESAIKENKLVKYKDEFDDSEAYYLGIILILLKKFNDGTINHLITYHNTVSKAKKFAEFLEKINGLMYDNEISVTSIDGSDSMKARKNIIREFSDASKAIICSARVLNEGVNIPICDSVCFVDNRDSTIDIIQCIGRCLRLFSGKNMAYIIVPTFIENFDTDDFDKNVFGNVIRILKALKNTDERIAEYFQLKFNGGIGKKNNRELVARETYEDVSKEINLDKWKEYIDSKIWKVIDTWNYKYDQTKKWMDVNNKIPSPVSNDISEKILGVWCTSQRENKKNNKLTDYKIKLLNELNEWYWDSDDIWNKKYLKLEEWINYNKRIPSFSSKNSVELQLANWCAKQRENYKNDKILKYQIELLDKIKGWYWSLQYLWDDKYTELKKWININNRMPLAKSNILVEKSLGAWCSTQRENYKNNKISNNRINQLNELDGWYWNLDDLWNNIYRDVKKWIKINNKIPSKRSTDPIEQILGSWCATQRASKRNNKLTKNRIKKLNKLDGWYWKFDLDTIWNKTHLELEKWININNKLPSKKSTDPIEKILGKWCDNQRQIKKNNKLSNDRIEKLSALDGWYWINTTIIKSSKTFDEQYKELNKWIKKNRRIPSKNSKNQIEKVLGNWCGTQRSNKKNNKLSEIRIGQLNMLPGWYWINESIMTPAQIFEEKYLELKQWLENNGRIPSRVSKDIIEKKLGNWCHNQRLNKRKNTLSIDHIERLNKLPEWYWLQ